MIDYTKAQQKVRNVAHGPQREQFDRLILTSKDIPHNKDDTKGTFYKFANPNNQGLKVYVLSYIEPVQNYGDRYYIECEYQDPAGLAGKLKKCFLVLEQGNHNTFGGYKVIEIRDNPPLPYRK